MRMATPSCSNDQDRKNGSAPLIQEGLALIDKAIRQRKPGPYQIQAAIAGLHARADTPDETDWAEIDGSTQALERHTPSPVVTLNRAVAVAKLHGPQAALDLIAPLGRSP
jgi:RNA polymerase sigma-70 factor (ECF subfamily)